jgi:uncharacterized protein (DUF1330 family)
MMKRGYLFAELEITDSEVFFKEYMTRVGPVLKKWGARFLIATDSPDVIEGGREVKRVILLEFDSVRQAKDFYHSEEYQEVAKIRFRSATTHLYIMEGLSQD